MLLDVPIVQPLALTVPILQLLVVNCLALYFLKNAVLLKVAVVVVVLVLVVVVVIIKSMMCNTLFGSKFI